MSRILFTCFLCAVTGWCFNLDSLYQLAQPGEGYDKLLILDSIQVYNGGFTAANGKKSCIHGFGAIIDLGGASINNITIEGENTHLDIERCVIINGADSLAAFDYSEAASGKMDHLTLVNNFDGIRFWYGDSLTLKNSIIVNHRRYGVVTNDSTMADFQISFNNCWNNESGNYMCWFGSC